MARKANEKEEKNFFEKLDELKQQFSCEERTEFFHSGSTVFDEILSNGKGIPKGYMIEVAAPYGVGKSTLFLTVAKYLCSEGRRVVFIDTEEGLNDDMMESFGLVEYSNNNYFYRMQCNKFKNVEDILDNVLVQGTPIDVIMIDSVTNLVTTTLVEKSVEESIQPGFQARPLDIFLKKYRTKSRDVGVTMMFINQFRSTIGMYGSQQQAAGGNALKHTMDIRVEMKKRFQQGDIKTKTKDDPNGRIIGCVNTIEATKNRFAKPFDKKNIYILFGKGVSNVETIIEWMKNHKYMNDGKGGSYLTTLPIYTEPVKHRSAKERHEWVKENYDTLDDFIKQNGGYFGSVEEE